MGVALAAIVIGAIVKYVKKQNSRKTMVLEDVSKGDVEDFIKLSTSRIQNLRRYYYRLKEDDMRASLDKITENLKKIIKIIKEDPRDFV